jgi:hypothetical protein
MAKLLLLFGLALHCTAVNPINHVRMLRRENVRGASCGAMTNATTYAGKQIANVSFPIPPSIARTTCCSIATGFAGQRSKNSTDGVGFTVEVLGPAPKKYKDQIEIQCTAFDYGAKKQAAPGKAIAAGSTGPLAPFPPPPPSCQTFTKAATCPSRCFWLTHSAESLSKSAACSGCCDSPPISCGSNSHGDNAPVCAHIIINTTKTKLGQLVLTNTTKTDTTQVSVPAPKTFTVSSADGIQDVWYSVHDGEYFSNKSYVPFSYGTTWSAQCLTGCPPNTVYELGFTLLLDGTFDLSMSVGGNLTTGGGWSNDPFVVTGHIGDKGD